MIVSFRHRGLERLHVRGDRRRLNPAHVGKIERILDRLEVSESPIQMDLPGFRLHRLRGGRGDTWAVTVSANWRITFRFEGRDASDVDLVDYH